MINGIIYRIICIPTGEIYIGVTTKSLRKRWNSHISASRKCNHKMARAIRKYGRNEFIIEPIDKGSSLEELMSLEVFYIKLFDSFRSGLNSTSGGEGVLGFKLYPDIVAMLSVKRKAIWRDPEYRKKMSSAAKNAWRLKSLEEIENHKKRAKVALAEGRAKRQNRPRKEKPLLWKGKGYNMRVKTHCPKGHPYDENNTLLGRTPAGGLRRECKTCKRATRNIARDRRALEKRKEILNARSYPLSNPIICISHHS